MKTYIRNICLIAILVLIPAMGLAEPTTYDVDGDGIENNQDNCPDVWNEDQADNDGDLWGDDCDGDDDNDGLSDNGEVALGTDPFDPDSDDDGITDLYDCSPLDPEDRTYEDCFLIIEDNGGSGGPVCGNGVCETGEDSATCPDDCDGDGPNPSVNPPVDSDGDGCSDSVEVGMRTDPLNPDTDEDGIPDCNDNCPIVSNAGQEQVEPTIPIGIACYGDYDGDGVCDNDEDIDGVCRAGPDNCIGMPNPFQLDSDGDGVGNVCDPDSVDFGGPEPLVNVQGGGGGAEGGGCTLLAGAGSAAGTANGLAFAMMLTSLITLGVIRKRK